MIEGLGSGGAERVLFTNLKHLNPERVRSTVVTVFGEADYWKEPIEKLGVGVVCLECKNYRSLPRALLRLRGLLRVLGPDVIHTHLWAANVIGRLAGVLCGIPTISSIHNPEYEPEALTDVGVSTRLKCRCAQWLDWGTARFGCQRLIAVSKYVGESSIRSLGLPAEAIEVLYNPVDTVGVRRDRLELRTTFLKELKLPADSLILLNVARLAPQKGLLDAIRAMPVIRKRYPEVHLVSLGSQSNPAWLERIKTEIAELGQSEHVHLLGARRDVFDWLHACDLFLFPSHFEGLGIALIEAMAAGCACIATRIGPIPEIIQHGENGWLVDVEKPNELANATCLLLEDPGNREALGRAASLVADRFRPETAAAQLSAIYEKVVRHHG
jgi:glycosyltransferase involved in cell wall biosynthesis